MAGASAALHTTTGGLPIGIHIKTLDDKPEVGDYIYVHGKVAAENNKKIISADSIDIMCAGWGILPPS